MSRLTRRQDAFGLALWEHLQGKGRGAVVERDDGVAEPLYGLGGYFAPSRNWPKRQRRAIHLGYHRHNRRRGRMAGQVRMRVRYRNLATPWFNWLLVSKAEMRQIVAGTGWRVARFIDSPKSMYVAALEKEQPS